MTSNSVTTAAADTPFPVGVYVGQPDNSNAAAQDDLVSNLSAFESALGVVPAYFDTYTNVADPISNWVSQNGWQAASWAATPQLSQTTPILDLPLTSTQDNADQDYKNFAAGKYDNVIASLVKTWAQAGDTTEFWRLGWEMNLNGSADYAGDMGTQQQADWIAAFQHVATVIRQDAAADGVTAQIIWNPGVDSYGSAGDAVANLFPGSQYVDVIGADVYSDAYNFSLYDFTTGKTDATFAQWASNPANLLHYYEYPAATQWGDDSSGGHSTTLQSLIDLAKSTGKPLAIVETGAGDSDNSGHDVTDNSAFVDFLYGALSAAQQQGVKIDFVNIWDSNGGGNYEFTQSSDGKPNEEAAWVEDFGNQSGSTLAVGIVSQSLLSDTGVSATDNVSSNGAVTLKGTVSGTFGTTVAIWDGAVQLGYALLDLQGGWSFSATLASGVHALTAVATELVGNSVTSSAAAAVDVVTTPPALTIGAATGAILSGTVASAAAVSVVVYNNNTLLGAATLDGEGGWRFSPALAPGAYNLTVVATDAAGNTTSASTLFVDLNNVATFQSVRTTLDAGTGGFAITDTAADISKALDTLNDTKILSITISDNSAVVVSAAQLTGDAGAIGKLANANGGGYRLAVVDTPANIETAIANLAKTANIGSITATGGAVSISVAQAAALEAAGLSITSGAGDLVTLSDTAVNLDALTVNQIAGLRAVGVQSIVALDDAVALTAQQATALESANLNVSDPTLTDTAADIETLTSSQIGALTAVGVTAVAATDASVVLSVAQALAFENAGLPVSAPAGDSVKLSDTSAALAGLTAAEISGLSAIGVTAIASNNASLALSIAQTSAIIAAGLGVRAPANASVTKAFSNGSKAVFAYGSTGALARVTHTNADRSYDVHVYGATGAFQGLSYASYDLAYTASGLHNLTTFYAASGAVLATESFSANGGNAISIGGVLIHGKTVNGDGSYDVRYYGVTKTFEGLSYSSYDLAYTASGLHNLTTFYAANGAVLATESFSANGGNAISVGGVLVQQKTVSGDGSYDVRYYGVTKTFEGLSYSSYDLAYTASGLHNLTTFYAANGAAIATESFSANGGNAISVGGVLVQQKTVSGDGSYDVRYYGVTKTFEGLSYSSYDLAYTASGVHNLTTFYAANGAVLATESFSANGGNVISVGGVLVQQKTVNGDGSYSIAFGNIVGKTYNAYVNEYSSAGVLEAQAISYSNGTNGVVVSGGNLVVHVSANSDTLTAASSTIALAHHAQEAFSVAGTTNDIFSFAAGFGTDSLSGLGFTGANADSLNLSGLFSSYSDLQTHMAASGASTIITDTHGDKLTILGLSPSALTAAHVGF